MIKIIFFFFVFHLNAQSDLTCGSLITKNIQPKSVDAIAVCLHKKKKKMSSDAKDSLKRILKLKKRAKKRRIRDLARQKVTTQDNEANPLFENDSLSTEAFNHNIMVQFTTECNNFNTKLSESLINLRKRNPQCQKNPMYDVYLSSYRLNNKALKSYSSYSKQIIKLDREGKPVDVQLQSYEKILSGFSEFEGSKPDYIKDPYSSYPRKKRRPARIISRPKSGSSPKPKPNKN